MAAPGPAVGRRSSSYGAGTRFSSSSAPPPDDDGDDEYESLVVRSAAPYLSTRVRCPRCSYSSPHRASALGSARAGTAPTRAVSIRAELPPWARRGTQLRTRLAAQALRELPLKPAVSHAINSVVLFADISGYTALTRCARDRSARCRGVVLRSYLHLDAGWPLPTCEPRPVSAARRPSAGCCARRSRRRARGRSASC